MNGKRSDGWFVMRCEAEQLAEYFGHMGESQADERRKFFSTGPEDDRYEVPVGMNGYCFTVQIIVPMKSQDRNRIISVMIPGMALPPMTIDEAAGLGQALVDASERAAASRAVVDPMTMGEALSAIRTVKESEDD